MAVDVQVKQIESRTVAFLGRKGPYSQIPAAFDALYAMVVQNGLTPAGPPSGRYYSDPSQVPEDQAVWEAMAPVAGPASGEGIKQVEGYQAAVAMHRGPFSGVGATYQGLMAWIAQNGYRVAGPPEEVYLRDPGTTPEAELLTEVRLPVVKAG